MPNTDAISNGEIYTVNLTTSNLEMENTSSEATESPESQNEIILLEKIQETPPPEPNLF